jgi:hypothetical protein
VALRAVPFLNLNSVLSDGICKFMVEGKAENFGFVNGEEGRNDYGTIYKQSTLPL